MKVSVITNRGVGIVRSAANRHEKCEIVDCLTSTHFENTENELATKPLEWWDGATGTITMVRAGNGSLKVSVSFPATSYAQPLKSVGIRVKAQGDDRAYVLYAVSDENTAIALNRPYTCDYEIPINVSSDTIEDVGSEPVPGLEDYYTKTETDTAIGNAITALNLGAASQKGVDTSIGDASSSNLPTSDAVKAYVDAHSGGGGDTSNLGASIAYDSKTEKIELRNADGVTLSEIDATAFVKDGMLDSVAVSGGNLYFVFNTDAGKETISIPLSDFFDDSQYYTKKEIDGNYYSKPEIDGNYYSKSEINGNYFTRDEIINNYYTKTETDEGFYPKEVIDKEYYTKSEVDNKGYCTKTEINNGYYSKSQIDGGYIANASYNSDTNTLTLSSKDGSKQIDLDLS